MRYYDFISPEDVKRTPFKKVIKAKIKANRPLTSAEIAREKQKYEIAEELGLVDKVKQYGWSGLTSKETGMLGGIMTQRNKLRRDVTFKNGKKPKW
jgi:hypothetical protein